MLRSITGLALIVAVFSGAQAQETHTVTFNNLCGRGTPMLTANGQPLSVGGSVTINAPLIAAVAYLQTGSCGINGEGCTTVATTLRNPTSVTAPGSATDITIATPHNFSVPVGFKYFNGCEGSEIICIAPPCRGSFSNNDGGTVATCLADNVNLAITFCNTGF